MTYHGPGQIVGYPIVDLRELACDVGSYIDRIEEMLIRTLADFGVVAARDSRNRGVWVADRKVAALGVRVTRGITMHGFALNVRVDLDDYRGIVPCGIADAGVTSMHRLVPRVSATAVKGALVKRFVEVFGYDGQEAGLAEGEARPGSALG